MSTVAIITARGGSKRILNKNIKEFCGKPIIAYSIEAAIGSGMFDEIMVSTDDNEIAAVAKKYGAKIPFMRSEYTSGDYATTTDALIEVLEMYRRAEDKYFDNFCCIYPTAPFVTGEKLRKARDLLFDKQSDSVVCVVPYSFPPQRGFIIEKEHIRYLYPEHERTRSQDLMTIYHDCGQFYFAKTDSFLEQRSLVMEKTSPFVIPEEEVQDIDTVSDWVIAEIKYRRFIQQKRKYD